MYTFYINKQIFLTFNLNLNFTYNFSIGNMHVKGVRIKKNNRHFSGFRFQAGSFSTLLRGNNLRILLRKEGGGAREVKDLADASAKNFFLFEMLPKLPPYLSHVR